MGRVHLILDQGSWVSDGGIDQARPICEMAGSRTHLGGGLFSGLCRLYLKGIDTISQHCFPCTSCPIHLLLLLDLCICKCPISVFLQLL